MKAIPLQGILKFLEKEDNFVFLETAKCDAENYLSYVFYRPDKIVSTFKISKIKDCFAELNQKLNQGYYVAGFLAYEAGEAFEDRLRHKENYDFPILWFGIYKQPLIYDHQQGKFIQGSLKIQALIKKNELDKDHRPKNYIFKNIRPNISSSSYFKAIKRIKDLIACGFTYQVNYTFKLKFNFSGSAASLYLNLRDNQSVSYSGLIKCGHNFILSFSPELFFRKKGHTILTRPMKGTSPRGKDLAEDSLIAEELKSCLKNRSENLMIVDLLRNDLGKISTCGSVVVPRLFTVERYETLFQMTSDIKSRLKMRYLAFDIFSHIFPSGSVTGAPKIKTMQIIRQLEKEPRNVYTGSIGFFAPENFGTFNVAIRTILIDNKKKIGEMGVGSGIVYDSSPKKEYAECLLKANFLTKRKQDFQLIETMLWQPQRGFLFIDEHLRRLENSARFFDFICKREDILKALRRLTGKFGQADYRMRLLLFKDGSIKLEPSLFKLQQKRQPKIYLAQKRMYSLNPFLYHKTTNRKFYDEEYKRCTRLGYYDAIFTNEKGQITEGAISNVFICKDGKFYTPPVKCGLLDGVYRRHLLNLKEFPIKEKVLFKKDLFSAEEIYLSNSVRGLVRVQLVV